MAKDYHANGPAGASAQAAIDPLFTRPDAALITEWTPERCLREAILPWRRIGGRVVVLDGGRSDFDSLRTELEQRFGPVLQANCDPERLSKAVERSAESDLVARAETRTPPPESSRYFSTRRFRALALATLTLLAVGLSINFSLTISALSVVAMALVVLSTGLKTVAALTTLRHGTPGPAPPLPEQAELPTITLLAPLHREANIATHLLRRLARLNYPRDKLHLCLVVEQDDHCTRTAIAAIDRPDWISEIVVPPGTCTTKPRAMNYALDFTRGEIVGVYDAEDRPDPDQLLTVARHFAAAPPDVVCLQGVLDFYNTRTNWLSRCFTLEYAAWFRVVMPGLERLGLVLPLGGTTLFFRRSALDELGAWDAQNVTEDADLGLRLARHGYRTQMIPTVTEEEANARLWPWIKQRSRWLKGYAITYAVHMRTPLRLWRDLGTRRFLGIQIQFAGSLAAFALVPVLWSLWLGVLGLPHPFFNAIPRSAMYMLSALFILCEVINVSIMAWAATLADKRPLVRWAPTIGLYFPIAAVALYKAFYEMTHKPFYWDKTDHGIFLPGDQNLS